LSQRKEGQLIDVTGFRVNKFSFKHASTTRKFPMLLSLTPEGFSLIQISQRLKLLKIS
jgi:hypothetical protein